VAAPTYATSAVTAHNATTPKTASAGNRSAGDLVVVVIQQISGGSNVYTVSDDKGNTYTKACEQVGASSRYVAIYYSVVTTGGAPVTASVAATGGISYGFTVVAATPAASSTVAADAASNFTDGSAGTTHRCGAVGLIDTAADVFVVAGTATDASDGTTTDPTSFTLRQTILAQRGFVWTRESAGALTDERGQWSSTSNCDSTGAIASFKTVAGGGSTVGADALHHYLQHVAHPVAV
jgi:hypothetical protein